MGCCLSHAAGPNSPYPGGAPNASARAINPPPLSLPEGVQSTAHQQGSSRRRHRHQAPLDQHINKPLRPHQWSSTDRRWTRAQLNTERADFFDTRVTGRPEVWQTLRAALDVLCDPEGQDEGLDRLATAQTILDAAEISLPTGNLSNGAYDSLGNYYQMPEWVVSDPDNLVVGRDTTGDAKGEMTDAAEETAGEDDDDGGHAKVDHQDAERRRETKGKGVVDVRQQVALRARLSESGRDIQVVMGRSDSVRVIAKRVAEESGLASTKKIRMAYMGKILKESLTLESQGWQPGHVVNALVFNR